MTFGKNEPIIIVKMRTLRVISHMPEEQRGDEIRRRTTRSGMTAARRSCCGYRMNPQLIGNAL
jgi:hypothetical protein